MVEVQHQRRARSRREKPSPATASTPTPVVAGSLSGAGRRIGSPAVLAAALLVAAGLVVVGSILCIQNWTRGWSWTPRLILLMATNWTAILLALGVGLLWWWRAPANPTGRLLYVAGICQCCVVISRSWPSSRWAYPVGWVDLLTLPCLALIILGWPTGRPSPRLYRAVIYYGVGVAVVFLLGDIFRKSSEPAEIWPDPPQAVFNLPQVWAVLDAFQALVLNALPAIATIVWLVRRRRAVPPAVRPLITPITVAGVLLAGSLVLVHFGFQVFGALFGDDGEDIGVGRLLALLGNYFMAGFVAIGVLVAGAKRRRAVAVGTGRMVVDLRTATPVVSPSAAAAAIIGDPTATVRYRGADGGWIDSTGSALAELAPNRRLIPVPDGAGRETAGLEVSAELPVPPLLADLAISAIAARAANERATALADARRREVRARSRDLVAATDAGRVKLERNLHDGAQQMLVGLALTAGLRVRHADSTSNAINNDSTRTTSAGNDSTGGRDLINQIELVHREILALVDSTAPAALSSGLAGGLRSLAAACPINTSVDTAGDVPPDDPLALGLYLAAGEAITNAVKHSSASMIEIALRADHARVGLLLRDNGIGGVGEVPASVSSRIVRLAGTVRIESPIGKGTALHIDVPRPMTGGNPR